MVKSVKAIILASVVVSMSVMLINSCGVSNPAGSSGNPSMPSTPLAAMQASGGVAPAMPILDQVKPDNLPQWLAEIDAARPGLVPILFGASISPHLNANASSPNKVPFSKLCGTYGVASAYIHTTDIWNGKVNSPYTLNFGMRTDYYLNNSLIPIFTNINPVVWSWTGAWDAPRPQPPLNPPGTSYPIPCGVLPDDFLFPDDLFMGNGLPDGYYVLGGKIYDMAGGKVANKWPNDRSYKPGYYPGSPQHKLPQRLTIYTASPTIKIGETASFSATLYYTDGSSNVIPANQVSWTSSAPKAAYVDLSGMVTGKAKGTTYITASYQGLTAGKVTVDVERVNQCGMQFPKLQQFTGWDVIPPPYPNPDYNNWANYLYAHHTASEAAAGGVQNWGNVRVTFGTIGYFGCNMTCHSMVFAAFNPTLTPLKLNELLVNKGFYNPSNEVLLRAFRNPDLTSGKIQSAAYVAYNHDTWTTALDTCTPGSVIIAHVKDQHNGCSPGHFALIMDYRIDADNNTIFTAYDPSRYDIRYITESELTECTNGGNNILVTFN